MAVFHRYTQGLRPTLLPEFPMLTRFRSRALALALVAALATTSACANFSSFQSADVVPEGQSVAGVGSSFTRYSVETETTDLEGNVTGTEASSFSVPQINVWYRGGIAENLEAHAMIWLPAGLSAGVKYQLMGGRAVVGPSFSLGADLSYLSFSVNDEDISLLDVYVPVYTGYRVGEGVSMYLTPKYLARIGMSETADGVDHLAGATLGLELGKKTTLLIEGTGIYDLSSEMVLFNGGIGVAF